MHTNFLSPLGAVAGLAAVALLATSACSSSSKHASNQSSASATQVIATTATTASSGGATDATTSGSSGDCAKHVVAQICTTVSITGAANLAGTAAVAAPEPASADPTSTCSQLATMSDTGSRDLGDTLPAVGGHPVMWDASFSHYNGPGSYGMSDFQFYVSIDNTSYNTVGSDAKVSIVVKPDFASTLTFSGLQSSDSNGTVAGSITWTCVDPS